MANLLFAIGRESSREMKRAHNGSLALGIVIGSVLQDDIVENGGDDGFGPATSAVTRPVSCVTY